MSFAEMTERFHMKRSPPKLSFHLTNLKKSGIISQDEDRNYFLGRKGQMVRDMYREIEKGISREVGL
jgi:predicted transcriptional regulator